MRYSGLWSLREAAELPENQIPLPQVERLLWLSRRIWNLPSKKLDGGQRNHGKTNSPEANNRHNGEKFFQQLELLAFLSQRGW
jgi:hypothetical protein